MPDLTGPLTDPIAAATLDPPSRVRLRPADPQRPNRPLDGGWWPRSVDLSAELPPLLQAMSQAGLEVSEVTYNATAWNRPPRQLNVGERWVKLGGYRTQDRFVLTLVDDSGRQRVDLVVIPASSDAEVAERALALAGAGNGGDDAASLLERANDDVPAGRPIALDGGSRRRIHLT